MSSLAVVALHSVHGSSGTLTGDSINFYLILKTNFSIIEKKNSEKLSKLINKIYFGDNLIKKTLLLVRVNLVS